jgi:hypothetical protein
VALSALLQAGPPPNLRHAVLSSAGLDDAAAAALARALAAGRCPRLAALHLPLNRLAAPAARLLAAGLLLHGALRALDLSDNPLLGDPGADALAALLPSAPSLAALALRGCSLGPLAAAALAAALFAPGHAAWPLGGRPGPARRCRLEALDLRRNPGIGDGGAAALGAALGLGPEALRELDVSGCGVTARGAAALAAGLRRNGRLRRLTVRAAAGAAAEGGGEAGEALLARLRAEAAGAGAVMM